MYVTNLQIGFELEIRSLLNKVVFERQSKRLTDRWLDSLVISRFEATSRGYQMAPWTWGCMETPLPVGQCTIAPAAAGHDVVDQVGQTTVYPLGGQVGPAVLVNQALAALGAGLAQASH